MRNLGGAIGIALCGTVLNDRTNLHYFHLMEHVNVGSISMRLFTTLGERMGDPQLARLQEMKQLARLVYREALVLSFADAFLLLSACFLMVVVLVPFSRSCYMDDADRGLHQEH
jgi:DHA2 family multidrug resistance protein